MRVAKGDRGDVLPKKSVKSERSAGFGVKESDDGDHPLHAGDGRAAATRTWWRPPPAAAVVVVVQVKADVVDASAGLQREISCFGR